MGWKAFEAKYGFSREKEAAALHAMYGITRFWLGIARETGEAPKE